MNVAQIARHVILAVVNTYYTNSKKENIKLVPIFWSLLHQFSKFFTVNMQ